MSFQQQSCKFNQQHTYHYKFRDICEIMERQLWVVKQECMGGISGWEELYSLLSSVRLWILMPNWFLRKAFYYHQTNSEVFSHLILVVLTNTLCLYLYTGNKANIQEQFRDQIMDQQYLQVVYIHLCNYKWLHQVDSSYRDRLGLWFNISNHKSKCRVLLRFCNCIFWFDH